MTVRGNSFAIYLRAQVMWHRSANKVRARGNVRRGHHWRRAIKWVNALDRAGIRLEREQNSRPKP